MSIGRAEILTISVFLLNQLSVIAWHQGCYLVISWLLIEHILVYKRNTEIPSILRLSLNAIISFQLSHFMLPHFQFCLYSSRTTFARLQHGYEYNSGLIPCEKKKSVNTVSPSMFSVSFKRQQLKNAHDTVRHGKTAHTVSTHLCFLPPMSRAPQCPVLQMLIQFFPPLLLFTALLLSLLPQRTMPPNF